MALKLADTIFECLHQKPEQKFTAREIATWIFETYPDECQQKLERSAVLQNNDDLMQQLAAEVGATRPIFQKRYPKIKTTEGRPRKYYFTEITDSAEVEQAEQRQPSKTKQRNGSGVKEHNLYPVLAEFLWSEHHIYSKRIDEKRSRNTRGPGGNKWLYPDLVGMEDLSGDWDREIKDCVQEYADKKTKLWSFEVKVLINRSNLREVFFQTVSNSSWANLSYLVASEVEGTDSFKELRMLSSLHGVGLIYLDTENPAESQIMIPAKERSEIDWNTANRLIEENKDFMEYIKLIRQFYQTGEIRQSDWDMSTIQD